MIPYEPGMLVIERFELKEKLGAGAMGYVYGAIDRKLAEDVALKFLPSAMAEDMKAVEQFTDEVRKARRVSGKHILRVYDMWEDGRGGHFVTMEWAKGGDLDSYRLRNGPFSWDDTRQLLVPILRGLQSIHESGIIHRDIKPRNILFRDTNTLVVADFGISKTIMSTMSRITNDPTISGTPAYMAPEVLQGSDSIGFYSDIYSIGCLAYELLVGQTPFHGNVISVIHMQTHADPNFKDLPREAKRWIGACLIKDPSKRVQTVSELLDSLYDPWKLPEYISIPQSESKPKKVEYTGPKSTERIDPHTYKIYRRIRRDSAEPIPGKYGRIRRSISSNLRRFLPLIGIIIIGLITAMILLDPFDQQNSNQDKEIPQQTEASTITGMKPYNIESSEIDGIERNRTGQDKQNRIQILEEKARTLHAENKFTSGEGGNTWEVCQQIFDMDPDNPVCKELISDMIRKYATWIESSLEKGKCDQAEQYAASLKQIGGSSEYDELISECKSKHQEHAEISGICPYCGEATVHGHFCTKCGGDLSELTVVCPKCLKWTADEKFCIHCGHELK